MRVERDVDGGRLGRTHLRRVDDVTDNRPVMPVAPRVLDGLASDSTVALALRIHDVRILHREMYGHDPAGLPIALLGVVARDLGRVREEERAARVLAPSCEARLRCRELREALLGAMEESQGLPVRSNGVRPREPPLEARMLS